MTEREIKDWDTVLDMAIRYDDELDREAESLVIDLVSHDPTLVGMITMTLCGAALDQAAKQNTRHSLMARYSLDGFQYSHAHLAAVERIVHG
jgi:hypothetical protein